ncbi:hypothetical protein Tco_1166333 [Tanacetum coccineum]
MVECGGMMVVGGVRARCGKGDGVSNWTSSGVIGERSIEDEEVSLVDGVLKGALGALEGSRVDAKKLIMVDEDEEDGRCLEISCFPNDLKPPCILLMHLLRLVEARTVLSCLSEKYWSQQESFIGLFGSGRHLVVERIKRVKVGGRRWSTATENLVRDIINIIIHHRVDEMTCLDDEKMKKIRNDVPCHDHFKVVEFVLGQEDA